MAKGKKKHVESDDDETLSDSKSVQSEMSLEELLAYRPQPLPKVAPKPQKVEVVSSTGKIAQQNGIYDFSLDVVQSLAREEDRRLSHLQRFRTQFPLFMEDHDFVYRLIACHQKQIDGKKFLCGPSFNPIENDPNPDTAVETGTKKKSMTKGKCKVQSEDLELYLKEYTPPELDPQSLEAKYSCPICCTIMADPTSLLCGHYACKGCLTEMFEANPRNKKCPTCKTPVKLRPEDLQICRLSAINIQQKLFLKSGKKEREVIQIDMNKIMNVLKAQLSLYYDDVQQEANVETLLKASKSAAIDTTIAFRLSSTPLAYRILKDSVIQHPAHQNSTLLERQRICELMMQSLASGQEHHLELHSQLPQHLLSLLLSTERISIDQQFTTFATFLQAIAAATKPTYGSQTDATYCSARTFDTPQQTLSHYLPDHLVRQCARRAGALFEDCPTTSYRIPYHESRMVCWAKLLIPLMKGIANITSVRPSAYEYAQGKRPLPGQYSNAKLVVLEDVFTVLQEMGYPQQVYGFGYPGVPRGILGNGVVDIMQHTLDSTYSLDEIALSVLHDMLISKAVDIIQHAYSKVKKVPVATSFEDAATQRIVCYEKMTLEEVQVLQKVESPAALESSASASAQPPTKKAKGGDKGKSIVPTVTSYEVTSKVWNSEVYRLVDSVTTVATSSQPEKKGKVTTGTMKGKGQKRNATELENDEVEEGGKSVKLITLDAIKTAIRTNVSGPILTQILAAVDRAVSACQSCNSNSFNKEFVQQCGFHLSPHMLLLALQDLPEFNKRGASLSLTVEALIAMTAALENLFGFIFDQCRTSRTDNEKYISPRDILLVIKENKDLDKCFAGIIRNGGVLPVSLESFKTPADIVNNDMEQRLVSFNNEIQCDYGGGNELIAFVHPLTGGFSCPATQIKLTEICKAQKYPLPISLYQIPTLEVLASLTIPPRLPPGNICADQDAFRLDNLYRRKIQSLSVLCTKHRQGLPNLVKSPAVMWRLRCNEVIAAKLNSLPIFAPEEIHRLCECCYKEVVDRFHQSTLFMSMDACEFIGCLLENILIQEFKQKVNKLGILH
jgi:hypothetical protein